jgi:hypothetical protein
MAERSGPHSSFRKDEAERARKKESWSGRRLFFFLLPRKMKQLPDKRGVAACVAFSESC